MTASQFAKDEFVEDQAVEWPEINTNPALKPLPDFPLDAMPGILKDMTTEISESVQIAPEVAALILLTITGAAAGRENVFSIKDGVETRPNIYGLIFVERGGRKSSSYTPALKPVYNWISNRQQDYKRKLSHYCLKQKERDSCESKIVKFETKSKDNKADAQTAYNRLQDEIEEMKEDLRDPAFIADDTTPEGFFELFERCQGQGAIFSDDGRSFVKILKGLYSGGESREEFHLRGFDCNNPMIKHRAGKAAVIIEKPFESALIMLQVDFLTKLAESEDLFQSGFISRWLFCFPDSLVGTRFYSEREISKTISMQYEDLITGLLDQNYSRKINNDQIYAIDPAAKELWIEFNNQTEKAGGPGGDFHEMLDIAIRFRDFARKLALIMAITEERGTITPQDMERAILLTRYYATHAERSFAVMKKISLPNEARRVLRTITRNQYREFSLRDIERAAHMTAAEAEVAISILSSRHYVRAITRQDEGRRTGRKPSATYETNPEVLRG
jgi:hypothetical protein